MSSLRPVPWISRHRVSQRSDALLGSLGIQPVPMGDCLFPVKRSAEAVLLMEKGISDRELIIVAPVYAIVDLLEAGYRLWHIQINPSMIGHGIDQTVGVWEMAKGQRPKYHPMPKELRGLRAQVKDKKITRKGRFS